MMNFFRLLRPDQWIKNLFVIAPLIFAHDLFEPGKVIIALSAFIAFSLTASAVYILNDLADVEADRLHPVKRHRPLAAGIVSKQHAVVLFLVLITAVTLLVVSTLPSRFGLIVVMYFVLNVAYSYGLKDVILLDVFVIAAGFMLRVLAGAAAIQVAVSSWIILCTLFISLFLGFGKRRSELIMIRETGSPSKRKVLHLYSVGFVDQMLTIAAAGAVISYALYTVAPRTLEVLGTEQMIYTTIFVLFGIFRYLFLVHSEGNTENPANAIITDRTMLAVVVLWVLACVGLIYFSV